MNSSIAPRAASRRALSARLLATASLGCLVSLSPSLAHAQTSSSTADTADTIVVTGRTNRNDTSPGGGLLQVETAPKAVQTVGRDFIAKQSPTANAQQLLEMLPSANVSSQDPSGMMPGQSYIRGLDSSETAWIMEGTPLNDLSNAKFYAEEYVEAEDLQSVSLQPGSVDITTPTTNATGGQVVMTLQDPTHDFGGLVDVSLGSNNLNREYIRVNTGDIGNTGIRGYVAYSHTYSDQWNGPGHANKHHVNVKFVKDFDNGSWSKFIFAYNYEIASLYRQPTLAQFKEYGNHYSYSSDPSSGTSYYRLANNPYMNFSASMPTHAVLSDKLSFDDTPYLWQGVGNGTGGSTATQGSTYAGNQLVDVDLGVDDGESVTVETIYESRQLRLGNTASLSYKLDDHNTLTAGWWYQYGRQHSYTRVGEVNADGTPVNYWGTSGYYTYDDGTPYDWSNYRNITNVNALFAQESFDGLNGMLHIDAGAKFAIVDTHIISYLSGDDPDQRQVTRRLLPQLGISFKPSSVSQFYATLSTNFRTPMAASLLNTYSASTGAQTQAAGSTKPETSFAQEIGYRYNGSLIVASISGFHYYFKNRQISLNVLQDGVNMSSTVNAGSQESWGVDAQVATRPVWFHLRPYATFEYLDAKIRSNMPVTSTLDGETISDYLPTDGKTQVASPHVQLGGGLDYDDGKLFVNVQAKYVSKQYSSFMNDESIPSYISTHAGIGYRLPPLGMLKGPQIQLNVQNLFNKVARTGVYSVKTNAAATTGVNGGTISASSPSYYLMPSRSFMVTLSSSF